MIMMITMNSSTFPLNNFAKFMELADKVMNG